MVAFVSCTFNFSSLWSNLGVFAGISSYFGPSFPASFSVRRTVLRFHGTQGFVIQSLLQKYLFARRCGLADSQPDSRSSLAAVSTPFSLCCLTHVFGGGIFPTSCMFRNYLGSPRLRRRVTAGSTNCYYIFIFYTLVVGVTLTSLCIRFGALLWDRIAGSVPLVIGPFCCILVQAEISDTLLSLNLIDGVACRGVVLPGYFAILFSCVYFSEVISSRSAVFAFICVTLFSVFRLWNPRAGS